MADKTVKLRLSTLEDRLVPASVAVETAQTMAQSAIIAKASIDPRWLLNPALKTRVTALARSIHTQSQELFAAVNAARGAKPIPPSMAPAWNMAKRNSAFATNLAKTLKFDIDPTKPSNPNNPGPNPKTDAGMTNALPNVNAPNWVARANGLKTWDVVTGTGDPVATGDSITIFYTGWLLNGTVFDSRRSPSPAITFALGNLIQGWQQGIPGMRPGGIRRLYIPAALAYGANGSPPSIPANADLVFEIKVTSHT